MAGSLVCAVRLSTRLGSMDLTSPYHETRDAKTMTPVKAGGLRCCMARSPKEDGRILLPCGAAGLDEHADMQARRPAGMAGRGGSY